MRPKLKDYFRHVTSSENGIIRVKMERTSLEINDPDGKVMAFIQCLDGTRSLDDIEAMCNLSREEILHGLQMLNQYRMLEAEDQGQKGLSDRELVRYKNNLTYFSLYESTDQSPYAYQQRLKESTVAVLGLGSGSVIAAWLASMGVGKIIGVDFDHVELNSDVTVDVYDCEINTASTLSGILDGVDFVINAIDSPPVQGTRFVNSACLRYGIPAIHIAIGNTLGFFYRVNPFVNGCTDCRLIDTLRQDAAVLARMKQRMAGTLPEVNVGNPGFAPNVAILTSLVASEVSKHLTGYHPVLHSTFTVFDVHGFQLTGKDFPRLPECPSCGANRKQDQIEPSPVSELIEIAEGILSR